MSRCLGVGLLCLSLTACGQTADLVIQGGAVWTGLSSGAPQPGAVAFGGGKILAVGDSAAVARYLGARTRVMRADGGLVMPGFADGHTHFIGGGFQLASVDLRGAATPQEFIRRLKEYARAHKPGEWITGGDWDHTRWAGQPLPRHEWIDSVTPDNPVFVSRLDGHEALANAAAMRAAGITKDTPTPPGGEVLRDARTGEPIGIFKDQALDLIGRVEPEPSAEQRDSALARALAHAASLGVTATAHMSASWADLASYRRLEHAGRLTLRATLYLPLEHWRDVADTLRRPGRPRGARPAPPAAGPSAVWQARRDSIDAALPRHRRRPLGRATHRSGAHQDDLRLPHTARHRGKARLRVRLDRRAARSYLGGVRGRHTPYPRRQEPEWLGDRKSVV